MPRLRYTAAKGLFEDNDSSSGFVVGDVAVTNEAVSVELGSPVYTFTILDSINNAATGVYSDNVVYHDIDLTVYKANNTAVRVTLDQTGGDFDGNGDHTPTSSGNLVTIGTSDTAQTIARNIGIAFNTADSELLYKVSTGSGTHIVTIYSTGVGRLSGVNNDLMTAVTGVAGEGVFVNAKNGGNNNKGFTAGDILAAVTTRGQSPAMAGKLNSADSRYWGGKQSIVFTAASGTETLNALGTRHDDPSKAAAASTVDEWGFLGDTNIVLSDGDSAGQELLLINNCAFRAVSVFAENKMTSTTADRALMRAGSLLKLVWNGSFWAEPAISKSGTVTIQSN